MNRVAIELDEVLFPFIKPMVKHFNKTIPNEVNSCRQRHVCKELLNVDESMSRKMIRDYSESEKFPMIQPTIGSQPILRLLRPRFDKIYIVSERPQYMRTITEDWVEFHYPGIFDDIIFTNNYMNYREIEKYDVCKGLNLDTLIDDDEIDCAVCLRGGMNVIHFAGDNGKVYPWSRYDQWSVLGWTDLYGRVHKIDVV
jgi:hypothetical protein